MSINGEKLDGSIALFRCIEREVKRNSDFLFYYGKAGWLGFQELAVMKGGEVYAVAAGVQGPGNGFPLLRQLAAVQGPGSPR